MNLIQRALFLALFFLLLVGAGYFLFRDAPSTPRAGTNAYPAITVEATYPGADAKFVMDTVGDPFEQQINGVEGMLHMASQAANDGTYKLTVTFRPGTNIDMAQVLVQNRMALALPVLPVLVGNEGVTVKKKSPGLLMMATLSSANSKYDTHYLSNYATIQITDELVRLAGVADVALLGKSENGVSILLQPEKLAAFNLSAADVVKALEEQKLKGAPQIGTAPAPKGQPFHFTINTLGRLTEPKQVADIIIKTDIKGGIVRLRDVAKVELATQQKTRANLNGKAAVVLCIYPLPEAKSGDLKGVVENTLGRLRRRLPDGLSLDLAFDFTPNWIAPDKPTTPEYLLLDVLLPDSASAERYFAALAQCEKVLRQIPGVKDVLTLSGNPFDRSKDRKCILVRLAPAAKRKASREEVTKTIRTRLAREVKEMATRIRDLSGPNRFPRCAFPINLALTDGGNQGQAATRKAADKLVEHLNKSGKVADLWVDPGSRAVPNILFNIDRARAAAAGVSLADITKTLSVYLGSQSLDTLDFARTIQVRVQIDGVERNKIEDIQKLMVRSGHGKMVPLGTIVTAKTVDSPKVVHRLDGHPALWITGNLAKGASLAEIRTLAETLGKDILPKDYRLTWIDEAPPGK